MRHSPKWDDGSETLLLKVRPKRKLVANFIFLNLGLHRKTHILNSIEPKRTIYPAQICDYSWYRRKVRGRPWYNCSTIFLAESRTADVL
jgi:hypothetical protein